MPPKITGIAHVELSVSDLDASVAWYCRMLGAKEVWRAGGPFTPRRIGLDHLSFQVADEAAIEAWRVHLDELGIQHDPVDDQGFALGLNLRDPDGIALEFYVLRPG